MRDWASERNGEKNYTKIPKIWYDTPKNTHTHDTQTQSQSHRANQEWIEPSYLKLIYSNEFVHNWILKMQLHTRLHVKKMCTHIRMHARTHTQSQTNGRHTIVVYTNKTIVVVTLQCSVGVSVSVCVCGVHVFWICMCSFSGSCLSCSLCEILQLELRAHYSASQFTYRIIM